MAKRCPACERALPASAFGRNKSLRDGLSFYCLDCNRERNNRWYRDHQRRLGKEVRDHSWIPDGFRWCPDCKQAVAHENYTRNSRTSSGFGSRCKACHNAGNNEAYWKRAYGLSKAQVGSLRVAQGNVCAICGQPNPQHLDHDHVTGRIRRLLCQRCNHGLGLFRDDPFLLRMAALYVETHRDEHEFEERLAAVEAGPDGASRPGQPPVGSDRRPGGRSTSMRTTGRTSGSRRRKTAGEADA